MTENKDKQFVNEGSALRDVERSEALYEDFTVLGRNGNDAEMAFASSAKKEVIAQDLSPTIAQPPTEQLKIVIVGHVDHGKSTFVGRLFHDTGSLAEGKLEQLKAVSERRGVPFEWANLMDDLQ